MHTREKGTEKKQEKERCVESLYIASVVGGFVCVCAVWSFGRMIISANTHKTLCNQCKLTFFGESCWLAG